MPTHEPAPGTAPAPGIDPRQRKLGLVLHRLGVWIVPACLGAAIGFYLADQGLAWLPDMLGLLLIIGALALLFVAGGRALQGDAFRKTAHGREVRRRVLVATFLAMAAGVTRLAVFWVSQDSPLTELERPDFDPSRAQRSRHLRSFLLTYAAELSLYEKATRLTALLGQNPNVVKFIDAPHHDRELGVGSFSSYRQQLQGTRDAARISAGRRYLAVLERGVKGREEARAAGVEWLWDRIERHLSVLAGYGKLERGVDTAGSDLEVIRRGVRRVWYPAQKGVAEWMGDTRLRRVGWYLIDEGLQEGLEDALEPGDVLLTRKSWYLSNVGLPGFWPHAVLYLGDPDKLAAYFDDPEVHAWLHRETGEAIDFSTYLERRHPVRWRRYRAGRIAEPYRVIEAISEGVVFNTLDHCVGDYAAAIRPRLSKLDKAQAIAAAFAFLDRPYDFDFDFATDHALVCTELVWRAYRPAQGKRGLTLPLVELAGRQTLPANELARLYVRERGSVNAQFEFVYFIDAVERQQAAAVSDEATFLETPERGKWDYRRQ
ncbi:protein tyrosine phosphatase [Pseudenhygromyxa sp. WMMC2535]|uniref:YiiX/YebB-like N1pC/P60 family cysteine hydrolase n=1 Tax=Pseudenhygromyxa sp. WMMC2535 TaxID=2712867 RepID=UPI0015563609|nr:YiiX/YebB-like N1pC/P60 family cysteine hydrolase [Pseudenhygromyxa sp. WMMC2535]NVB38961.1 protein tyrosine phosphatase [Pseudenhygromyxa sp. WMMC2535]